MGPGTHLILNFIRGLSYKLGMGPCTHWTVKFIREVKNCKSGMWPGTHWIVNFIRGYSCKLEMGPGTHWVVNFIRGGGRGELYLFYLRSLYPCFFLKRGDIVIAFVRLSVRYAISS